MGLSRNSTAGTTIPSGNWTLTPVLGGRWAEPCAGAGRWPLKSLRLSIPYQLLTASASNPRAMCSFPRSPEPLPASTVSLRSWLAAVCGNSFSFRELRLRTPLLDASSSARSKPRLGGRLGLLTCVGIDGGEQSRHRMGRLSSGPKLDIMVSLSTGLRVRPC